MDSLTVPEPTGTERTPRHGYGWLLFVFAVALAAWGLWHWDQLTRQAVDPAVASGERRALFSAAQLPLLPMDDLNQRYPGATIKAVVVHLRDPDCACSATADRHFLGLITRHPGDGVLFVVADEPGRGPAPARGLERVPRLDPVDAARLWAALPGAPAVAVFDGAGQPLFVGPYASGESCSTARGGPVDATMGAAHAGVPQQAAAAVATGCFCARTAAGGTSIIPETPIDRR